MEFCDLNLVGALQANQFTSSAAYKQGKVQNIENIENAAWPGKLVSSNWKVEFAGGFRTACLSRSSAGTPGPTQETL